MNGGGLLFDRQTRLVRWDARVSKSSELDQNKRITKFSTSSEWQCTPSSNVCMRLWSPLGSQMRFQQSAVSHTREMGRAGDSRGCDKRKNKDRKCGGRIDRAKSVGKGCWCFDVSEMCWRLQGECLAVWAGVTTPACDYPQSCPNRLNPLTSPPLSPPRKKRLPCRGKEGNKKKRCCHHSCERRLDGIIKQWCPIMCLLLSLAVYASEHRGHLRRKRKEKKKGQPKIKKNRK